MNKYTFSVEQRADISKFDVLISNIDEVDDYQVVGCSRVWINNVHIQANVISISTGMLHFEQGEVPFTENVGSMNLEDLKSLRFDIGTGDEFKVYRFEF